MKDATIHPADLYSKTPPNWSCYIIQSFALRAHRERGEDYSTYVGITPDFEKRFAEHREGRAKSTRHRYWERGTVITGLTRRSAAILEKYLKIGDTRAKRNYLLASPPSGIEREQWQEPTLRAAFQWYHRSRLEACPSPSRHFKGSLPPLHHHPQLCLRCGRKFISGGTVEAYRGAVLPDARDYCPVCIKISGLTFTPSLFAALVQDEIDSSLDVTKGSS